MRKQDRGLLLPEGDCLFISSSPPSQVSYALLAEWQSVRLQCRRPSFHPWIRRTPWRRAWQPTPVFLPGEAHGQRSLAGYSPRGRRESDTAERLTLSFLLRSCGQLRVQHNDGSRDRPRQARGCRLHPAGQPVQLCVSRRAGRCGTGSLSCLTPWLPP